MYGALDKENFWKEKICAEALGLVSAECQQVDTKFKPTLYTKKKARPTIYNAQGKIFIIGRAIHHAVNEMFQAMRSGTIGQSALDDLL